MKKEILSIPLKQIKPIKNLSVSKAYLTRMKKIKSDLQDFDLVLAVEKGEQGNEYLLVGGYDRYDFLVSSKAKYAPCIIEERSEKEKDLLTKIFNRLFNKGDSSKENRKSILISLYSLVTFEFIIRRTGLTKGDLENNYNFHPRVPSEFINENTNETTMNWVESLFLNKEVKKFLYERAGLPVGDSKRLTQDSIKIIKRFFKEDRERFQSLTVEQQISVLNYALNFKGIFVSLLKTKVSDLLKE